MMFFKLCKIFQFRMTDSGRARNFTSNRPNTSKTNYLKGYSVSLGNDPHLANHNPASSVTTGTEKLRKSPQADIKP